MELATPLFLLACYATCEANEVAKPSIESRAYTANVHSGRS